MREANRIERLWIMAGVALAALFLLRTAGMIFQGAVTGLGMFISVWILFCIIPGLRTLLFSLGGAFDLIVSFGLPYVISSVLGINGSTMLIATMTCGLLFTFTLATKKLGGPVSAVGKSAVSLARDSRASWEAWRKECDGRRNQVGTSGSGRGHHPRGSREREEGEEEAGGGERVIRLLEYTDYTVR